ncbi:peptide antibiotic transporter SbmA [Acidimangrovimonas sediminis]|uniref:peptide antibiotic transporter SbmA n=1 Tax=Acidimangrovimonas sediminis TaxID=2056283 RepID=UPI001E3CA511|nr:peptide antibiotic transporter SbmA [Acidimangrovimonas sediminis]
MFKSFFPHPRIFFPSVLIWTVIAVIGWYTFGEDMGGAFGMGPPAPGTPPVIGLGYFVTPNFLWFYIYCFVFVAVFTAAWMIFSPHPWQWWSIPGTALLIFSDYFSVQATVNINNWQRPFFDAIQNALDGKPWHGAKVTEGDLYGLLLTWFQIAAVWMIVYIATRFFTSHYVFRWRTAMNDYYMSHWPHARRIEGASQRVQEDTARFAAIVEDLGISMVDSVITLFAFLPVLAGLSHYVTELPIIGHVPDALLLTALFWSLFGTVLLAVAGIKLPGLAFNNQLTEAAYRKELVYGEDDEARAHPLTVSELFGQVRQSYFRYFFHFAYFNVFRGFYIQADNVFANIMLIPTIVAGKISFGIMQQVLTAFGQVTGSFQYLVGSWTTIIELLSIHKRLRGFEKTFPEDPNAPPPEEVVR